MYKLVFSLAVGLASLSVTPASAAPIAPLSGLSNDIVQVQGRMICDRRGRCYRAARRNVVRGYGYAPRRSYGYAPGYYGRSRGGVGVGIGGFGIGVGPRW